ncbi:TPA: hypothetical protein P1K85_001952 [Klebsiella pneumoniae]|uniref:hypothetical protein n=1 Tax=Klebsiella pneumoniae TaxID=573 RepID=UPI001CBC382B|nr:hypothetical protein [Klebsiella pneumoniae]EKV4338825.1 hypothetical protein [Klebsiella pneumoniae]MBZ1715714.1 hypothetical protein [Klebsiella pneumoniae]MCQ8529487.1 hypothetical protein [Klebsiella pneumoniae]MDP1036394.1 hypothetical protein [Klebsiella pneumoniae]HBQ7851279.1 hypothetical protein [Klebsiella pneumoniae]
MNNQGSLAFFKKVSNFGKAEKRKIHNILVSAKGGHASLCNYTVPGCPLLVRNKSSDDIPASDPEYLKKVKHAVDNSLWHIHAGFYNTGNDYPIYNGYRISSANDLVSDWVLHYQSQSSNGVYFVNASPHPMNILDIVITTS